jgi:hypothetical protein
MSGKNFADFYLFQRIRKDGSFAYHPLLSVQAIIGHEGVSEIR